MKLLIAVILILSLGTIVCADDSTPSRLARYSYYGGLHGLDAYSTDFGIARGRIEANPGPWMQTSAGRWISKGVGTVILAEADLYLSRRKHKKTLWLVRGVAGGALGYAACRNFEICR